MWSVCAGHALCHLPDDTGSPKSLSSSGGNLCRCGPRGKYNGDMKQEQGLSCSRGISCSARCFESLLYSHLPTTSRCSHGYYVQACSRTSKWRSVPCYTVEAGQHCSQLGWLFRWALCWAPLPCSLPPASTKYFEVERTVWTSVVLELGRLGVTSYLSPPGVGWSQVLWPKVASLHTDNMNISHSIRDLAFEKRPG